MKNLLILITIMFVGGCAAPLTPEQKPKSLRDSVVGEYEMKRDGFNHKYVFLENGVWGYVGKKKQAEGKWSIVDGKIHTKHARESVQIWRINPDKSITFITVIYKDGKRLQVSVPPIFKKIN